MITYLSLLFVFSLVGYYLYNRIKINEIFSILNTTSEILNQDAITKEEAEKIVKQFKDLFELKEKRIEEEGLEEEKEIEEVDEDSFFKNLEEFKEYNNEILNEKIF
jgi:hypothetical protein